MNDNEAVYTDGKWEFDESVANCFEDMLERSIPQYDVMRTSVASLTAKMLSLPDMKKQTATILDIGCSDGLMIEKILQHLPSNISSRIVGIDVSEPMLTKAKHRLLDDVIDGRVKIEKCDLRTDFPSSVFDVITSVLSIQFTPIEHRQHIIQSVYDSLSSYNGAFIMVEKVLGNTDKLNKLFVGSYYDMKENNGYTSEQIDRKRLSLEGVLVPVTNDWNIDLLKQAGFRHVDVFWRWMNFVGYIAIK